MNKVYFVYIVTNKKHSVLYTGVTNNLTKRIYGHKNKVVKGFSEKYNVIKLVYYEVFDSIETAIMREKQIKAGRRYGIKKQKTKKAVIARRISKSC